MKYKKGMKVLDNHGEKFIIDEVHMRQTPVGETIFFDLRSRKKSIQNIEAVTELLLDTYFKIV